jgi:hypothetical protein
MINRIIAGAKRAFGLHQPGRNLLVFPDDTFLVSYPKSGNTWTRFLIANLAFPESSPDWGNIDRLIPAPEVMSKRDFARMPRPRIIRTHDCFDPRYKRVIYIIRDPRDIAISDYHSQRKRKVIADNYPFEQFVQRYIAGETCEHGLWKEHVGSWLAARYGDPRFLLLRYEGLHLDTAGELGRIAAFLGITASAQQISRAVERSSARRMRELEQAKSQMCALTKDTRQDLPFVRAAKTDNWKTEMPDSCVAAIEGAWGPLLQWLGYKLVSDPMPGSFSGGEFPISLLQETRK